MHVASLSTYLEKCLYCLSGVTQQSTLDLIEQSPVDSLIISALDGCATLNLFFFVGTLSVLKSEYPSGVNCLLELGKYARQVRGDLSPGNNRARTIMQEVICIPHKHYVGPS